MSISWPLERQKDKRARNAMSQVERTRLWYSEWAVLILVSIGVAVSASFVSVATTWLAMQRQGYCGEHWYLAHHVCSEDAWRDWPKPVGWLIYSLLSLTYVGGAVLLVKFAPESVMSGVVELKSYFQGFDVPQLLNAKTLVAKLLGIGLVSASGLWLGQEAPLVHVAAAGTAILANVLPISEARTRDLVAASTSAGISVAFSAPLGGVLFGMETFMPSKSVMWRMFVCSMVATIMLRILVAPSSALGGIVVPETGLFHVSYDRPWHAVELLPFGILGVLGGLYGAAVATFAGWPARFYAKRPTTSVLVLTLVTALLSFPSVVSRIPSTELLADLFAECRAEDPTTLFCADSKLVPGLVYTLILGLVLAPLSFTLPIPSGFLFPPIVVGALMGRVMGLAMGAILERLPLVLSTSFCPDSSQHCITPGVYALVGAGAVLTGTTRLTVSSVVLMFEITGALSFIVPIMTGVIVAKWVSDTLSGTRSVYGIWDSANDVPVFPDASATVPDLTAADFMTGRDDVVVIKHTGGSAPRSLPTSPFPSVPIVGPNDEYIDLVIAKTGQSEPTLVLSLDASLVLIESAIRELGIRVVVFCSKGIFKGLATRSDVVQALNSAPSSSNTNDTAPRDLEAEIEDFEIED